MVYTQQMAIFSLDYFLDEPLDFGATPFSDKAISNFSHMLVYNSISYTIWLFNIAMEITIFKFGKPSNFLWAIASMAMLNNQRVAKLVYNSNNYGLWYLQL